MRYTKPKDYSFPDRTRTRPIPGEWDDEGKWFRCQVCGFVCELGKTELGEGSGVDHTRYYKDESLFDEAGIAIVGGEILDEAGLTIQVENLDVWQSDISTGCPLCGSKNWKRQ